MAKLQNPSPPEETNKITGIPSKELFIDMLVKDLSLRDAIGDLVDNSVDAAHKTAEANNIEISNFFVKITYNKNHFSIFDNAGGIEDDIARKYAFKLGKPKNYTPGKHTIGQFGIGMKRAFFKLGEHIVVDSVAPKSDFKIAISVNEWKNRLDEKDWDFTFETVNVANHSLEQTKTAIKITNLKEDVKKQFSDNEFTTNLINEIAREHQMAINEGLKIYINSEVPLPAPKITLISNKDYKPAYWSHEFPNGLKAEVLVGMSEDLGEQGGWYIFCNNRLILGPDTTEVTGWKGGRGLGGREGKELPKYHDQYFRFRGYVFFNCDDASKLPWTTSKTGIDPDSAEYAFVKVKMIQLGKQAKKIMDELKNERVRDNPADKRYLNQSVSKASEKVVEVSKVLANKNQLPTVIKYPKELYNPPEKLSKGEIQISYTKPLKEVEAAMKYFSSESANDAGSKTFDYFWHNQFGKK